MIIMHYLGSYPFVSVIHSFPPLPRKLIMMARSVNKTSDSLLKKDIKPCVKLAFRCTKYLFKYLCFKL